MGFAYKNTCYADVNLSLNSFRSTFPFSDGTAIVNLSTSSISGTGLITFTGTRKLFSTGASTAIPSQTVQLGACNTEFLDGYPVQDIFFIFVVVVCWALGFQSGMHR